MPPETPHHIAYLDSQQPEPTGLADAYETLSETATTIAGPDANATDVLEVAFGILNPNNPIKRENWNNPNWSEYTPEAREQAALLLGNLTLTLANGEANRATVARAILGLNRDPEDLNFSLNPREVSEATGLPVERIVHKRYEVLGTLSGVLEGKNGPTADLEKLAERQKIASELVPFYGPLGYALMDIVLDPERTSPFLYLDRNIHGADNNPVKDNFKPSHAYNHKADEGYKMIVAHLSKNEEYYTRNEEGLALLAQIDKEAQEKSQLFRDQQEKLQSINLMFQMADKKLPDWLADSAEITELLAQKSEGFSPSEAFKIVEIIRNIQEFDPTTSGLSRYEKVLQHEAYVRELIKTRKDLPQGIQAIFDLLDGSNMSEIMTKYAKDTPKTAGKMIENGLNYIANELKKEIEGRSKPSTPKPPRQPLTPEQIEKRRAERLAKKREAERLRQQKIREDKNTTKTTTDPTVVVGKKPSKFTPAPITGNALPAADTLDTNTDTLEILLDTVADLSKLIPGTRRHKAQRLNNILIGWASAYRNGDIDTIPQPFIDAFEALGIPRNTNPTEE